MGRARSTKRRATEKPPPPRPPAAPPARAGARRGAAHLREHADLYAAAATALAFVAHLFVTAAPFGGSGSDIVSLEHPLHVFATSWMRRGVLPLWNPFLFGGVPFQAGVHGYLYPGCWTGLVLPPALDIKVGIALHLVLAAVGGAWLARGRTRSRVAAYVGGVVFALSGFTVAHLFAGHRGLVATVAYLPWVAGLLDRWARGRGAAPAAGVAVAGLMMLCGHYQMVYVGASGILIFLVVDRLVAREDGAWRLGVAGRAAARAAAAWALVLAGGALLAAVQILPTIGTLRLSQRAAGGVDFASAFSSAPPNLLTYLLPNLFGNRVDAAFVGDWSYWEGLGYLGLAPLALVVTAIVARPWRRWAASLLVMSLGLLLALGASTPALRAWLALAPGADLFRAAGRYCVLATLFGSLLAAEGLDAWLDDDLSPRRRSAAFAATVALAVVGVATLVWSRAVDTAGLRAAIGGLAGKLGAAPREEAAKLLALARGDGAAAALVLAGAAACLHVARQPRWRPVALLGLAALVVGDLYHFGHRFLSPGAPERYAWPAAVVETLTSNASPGARVVVSPELRTPNHAAMYGLGTVGGYDIFVDGRYARYLNRANRRPLDHFVAYARTPRLTRLHRLLGAELGLTSRPLEQGLARARPGNEGWYPLASHGALRAYRDRQAVPRVALAHAVEVVPDEEQTYARLEDPAFALDRTALLEAPLPAATTPPTPAPPGAVERAVITRYEPNRVAVDVTAASAAVLVLSDTLHPGWRARLDGRPVPLVHANRVMRAVPVPAGRHTVEMRYLPASFVGGAVVSGLAAVGLVLVAGRRRRARRRAARREPTD